MALIVHKYGGTSMGSTDRIKSVAVRVAKWVRAGHNIVVVPSAMSGETNRLIGMAKQLSTNPDERDMDMICSTGEQVSVGLLSIALKNEGIDTVAYSGWQIPIKTDNSYTKARIESINGEKILADITSGKVVVITGFQGVDDEQNVTTLGRGGSDTSAVAIAAAINADECLIYTDVDGVYTTDPRIVDSARRLSKITFEEMLEMASLGSKVLQIRSVEFAGKYKVKTRVLSSMTDPLIDLNEEMNSGTLISFEDADIDSNNDNSTINTNTNISGDEKIMEKAVISGIASQRDEAKITLKGVPDTPGIAASILGPIARANIDVDMIIQNQSFDGKTDFTFTVPRVDIDRALDVIHTQINPNIHAAEILSDCKVSKVSVVGVGMRSHVGIASLMFEKLAKENINIQLISTSEIKISVLIDEKYMEVAVRTLHKAFELDKI
jgi:aspartate kinase